MYPTNWLENAPTKEAKQFIEFWLGTLYTYNIGNVVYYRANGEDPEPYIIEDRKLSMYGIPEYKLEGIEYYVTQGFLK